MIALVRVVRALLIVILAFMTISFIVAVGTPGAGPLEKIVLLTLIGGCVYAAVKVSALPEWAAQRLVRR